MHAHPDDEIGTGGVMMRAKDGGRRVVLVTATRGEAGEIHNMDEATSRSRLGEIRTKELLAADEILGVDRQEFLGYRDSGMVDMADNKDPRSFQQATLEDAAAKLATYLREERPDVVVTYSADGLYGHPDHVKAHRVTNAALDLLEREGWTPRKEYYLAIPRSMMQGFAEQFPDEARDQARRNMTVPGTPDDEITTRVDVRNYVERKRQAFRAHLSQNTPNAWWDTMQSQILELARGTEYYVLARGKPGSDLPETDMFVGID